MADIINWKVARVNLACSKANLDIDEGFGAQKLNVFGPLFSELRMKD